MKILLLDAYNLIHRAYHSPVTGENSGVYSFFRSLRPLIEKFDPDLVYFILEGYPHHRFKELPEYKGNRGKHSSEFHDQKDKIIGIMKQCFPFIVIRHPDYECDDIIANLIWNMHATDECVVVSTDTDFLQLYNDLHLVEIYNPIKKVFMSKPDIDYVKWKALRGDASDNVQGLKGIGDKRARKLLESPEIWEEFFIKRPDDKIIFEKNLRLIKFYDLGPAFEKECEIDYSPADFKKLKFYFNEMEFSSIIKEKAWNKFVDTFKKTTARAAQCLLDTARPIGG